MVNLPGVPVDVKNTLDIVNTVKAVSRGDINALIGVAQKYGSDVSKTADTVTVDGTTYNINNTPAGNLFDKNGLPLTPEASMSATFEDQMFNNVIRIRNEEKKAAQESADREQAARDAIRVSEKNIEDTLTNAGLVSTDNIVDISAQEQSNREQAAREAIRAQEQAAQAAQEQADREQAARESERAIEAAQAAKEQENREQAAREAARAQEQAIQLAQEQEDREQAAREAVRESERAIEAAQLAQEQADREQADFETERIAQEQADREQAARDAIKASERTIENTLIDAGLVPPTDVQELSPVTVTEKAITDNELFLDTLAQEKADREQAARDAIRVSEKTIEDTLIEAGLVSPTGVQELPPVTVAEKALPKEDIPITDNLPIIDTTNYSNEGKNYPLSVQELPPVDVITKALPKEDIPITDNLPIISNPNYSNEGNNYPLNVQELAPVTVTGKALPKEDIPITDTTNYSNEGNNYLKNLQELAPVTVTGKREQELDPVTIIGKKETPVTPKPPVIPKVPTVPAKPAPAKPAPAKPATPAEQLYQTTTQSNPTTPTDINYFFDMIGAGILPPTTQYDPVESLVNPPMSLEELLRHLRS
jgi:chemotaxis protein histidine kinase CheA